jgi:hypothetical protein
MTYPRCRRAGRLLVRCCLLALAAWATAALYYSNLPAPARGWAAAFFGVASLLALVGRFSDQRTRLGFLAAFAVVLGWWLSMPPSNTRNWQPDVALLPWAEVAGNRVTLHNIRNCEYRSETDYTVRHYDKTFDLAALKKADLFVVHWGSPYIAHTMLSFDFEGAGNVCISIETRKEVGEAYSNIKGFFRQYELTYVVADERDLIGLRSNYRGEQVYLYRLNTPPELIRSVFLDYLREVNSLRERPQWYNALTGNCTTGIRGHTEPYRASRIGWRLIVNGYLDEMLYEKGMLDKSLPFPELKKRSLINGRARGLDKSPDFSRLIRVGLPGAD